jgi:PAS domain S-box-containing protein
MSPKDRTLLLAFIIVVAASLTPLVYTGEYSEAYVEATLFFAPLIGFVIGYYVMLTYANETLTRIMRPIILALVLWSMAEFMWSLLQDGDAVVAFPEWAEALYFLGFLLLAYGLLAKIREYAQSFKGRDYLLSTIISVGLCAFVTYYLYGYKGISLAEEAGYLTIAYIAIDGIILFLSLLYTMASSRERDEPFWLYITAFIVITLAADATYAIETIDPEYIIGELSDTLYILSYGMLSLAFITFSGKESATLKEVEARYYSLFNHSGAPTIMANEENVVLLANQQFEQLTGYEKEDILGSMRWPDFVDAKDRKGILLMLNRMQNVGTSTPLTKELILHTRSGDTMYCSVTFSFVPHSDLVVITIYDLTQRKKLEMELKKINEDLQNFTFTVSHDLKEPLRNISSLATYLKRDYEDKLDEMGVEFLNMLVTSVGTMSQLVDDLLTLSRVGRKNLDFSFVDLNALIDEVRTDIEKLVTERNAKIVYSDLPKAMVQKTWMKQVFQNLITNAIKFNKTEQPTIEISCEDHDFYLEFRVKDNGIGIPPEYHERIFKLFEQLHPREEFGGTGAGLAIVKKIINEHKGDIWVESEVGVGTTFIFTIEKFFIGEA